MTQSGSLSCNLRLIHNLPEIVKLVARAMDLAMIGEEELDTTEMGEFESFEQAASSLDKQRICVNTQLKSSKKQLKLNVCVPKSNSVDRYAITCDVIAYHLVHLVSICVIYKCQSGIDFFY